MSAPDDRGGEHGYRIDPSLFHLANQKGDYVKDLSRTATAYYVSRLTLLQKRFVRFCLSARIPSFDPTLPFSPPPTAYTIEAFLRSLARGLNGRLDPNGKITLNTLTTCWRELRHILKVETGYIVPPDIKARIDSTIKRDIWRSESLSSKARTKFSAGPPVIQDVLSYLWRLDEVDYPHPRIRPQVALSLLLMLYIGLRPGEFLESNAHRRSNEGLHWGDVLFMLVPLENKQRIWRVQLRMRNRKNQRDREDQITFENLREHQSCRMLCPVALLFALAVADGALDKIDTPEHIDMVKIKSSNKTRVLRIADHMLHVPVFRRLNYRNQVSPTNIWRVDQLRQQMISLASRAGYQGQLTPYAIRRAHANILDRHVTAAQRRRQMGHKDDNTFQDYIGKTSGVDVQAIIIGESPNQSLIDFVASTQASVDQDAPREHGSLLVHARKRNDRPEGAAATHTLNSQDPYDPFEGEDAVDPFTSAPRRQSPSRFLTAYLRHDVHRHDFVSKSDRVSNKPHHSLSEVVAPLRAMATPRSEDWSYPGAQPTCTNRCRYCNVDVSSSSNGTTANLHLLRCHKKDLIFAARDAAWREFTLTQSRCLWKSCGKRLDTLTDAEVHAHFTQHVWKKTRCAYDGCNEPLITKAKLLDHLSCSHGVPVQDNLLETAQYCFECTMYFTRAIDYETHCAARLLDLDLFCGFIVRRNVYLYARRCPFCLGDQTFTAAARCRDFVTAKHYFKHLNDHLDNAATEWPLRCPHPLCTEDIASRKAFHEHLETVHHVSRYVKSKTTSRSEKEHSPGLASDMNHEASADEGACGDDDSSTDGDVCKPEVVQLVPPRRSCSGDAQLQGTCTNSGMLAPTGSAGPEKFEDVYLCDDVADITDMMDVDATVHRMAKQTDVPNLEQKAANEPRARDAFVDGGHSTDRLDEALQILGHATNPFVHDEPRPTSCVESRDTGEPNMSVGVQGSLGSAVASCAAQDHVPSLEHARIRTVLGPPMPIDPELMECDQSYMSARRESPTQRTVPHVAQPRVSSPMPLSEAATMAATGLMETCNGTCDTSAPADVSSRGSSRCGSPSEGPSANTAVTAQGRQYRSPGKTARPRKEILCSICGEAFGVTRKMVLHMMKQHRVSPHTCPLPAAAHSGPVCGKIFRENAKLRDHMETHANDARLRCTYMHCPHSFLTKDSLTEHLKVHRNYRYLCVIKRNQRTYRYKTNVQQKYNAHVRKCHPTVMLEG